MMSKGNGAKFWECKLFLPWIFLGSGPVSLFSPFFVTGFCYQPCTTEVGVLASLTEFLVSTHPISVGLGLQVLRKYVGHWFCRFNDLTFLLDHRSSRVSFRTTNQYIKRPFRSVEDFIHKEFSGIILHHANLIIEILVSKIVKLPTNIVLKGVLIHFYHVCCFLTNDGLKPPTESVHISYGPTGTSQYPMGKRHKKGHANSLSLSESVLH